MRTAFTILFMLVCLNCLGQEKQFKEYKTGELRFKLTIPYFNYISVYPEKLFRESKFGFFGESLGLEYSYKKK